MSDDSSFDLGSAVGMLVVIVVILAILIRLLPVLLQLAYQVLPELIVLWLIALVLRGMVKKLLE